MGGKRAVPPRSGTCSQMIEADHMRTSRDVRGSECSESRRKTRGIEAVGKSSMCVANKRLLLRVEELNAHALLASTWPRQSKLNALVGV